MMTFENILSRARALGEDADVFTLGEELPTIYVCFMDFVGFTEDGDEIYREYNDENAIRDFVNLVDDECEYHWSEGCTITYFFNGFNVEFSRTSDDI